MKVIIALLLLVFCAGFSKWSARNPVAADVEKGKVLYRQNCMSCHNAGRGKLTAIGLRDAWDEIPKPKEKWFIEYVQNPEQKHQTKDALIIKIEERLKKDGKEKMYPIPLTKEEIKMIIAYVKTHP